MKQNIYLLYNCNEWKENASMNLIIASTNKKNVIKEIKKRIKNKEFEYNTSIDFTKECLSEINNSLEFGYVEIVKNGEVI